MLKIEETRFADISRYRSQLMGLAIIFVVLFHVWLPTSNTFYPLRRLGNIGVDMFLFISGLGLWHSWTYSRLGKRLDGDGALSLGTALRRFFSRRYLRIYPTWIVVAGYFYISAYVARPGSGYSPDILNLAANVLCGWSFWRVDDLTFWYVPATMMLYTFAPAYMELVRRCPSYRWLPVAFMVLAAMVYYVPLLRHNVGHLEIFFSRIPIFLIGINAGEWIMQKRTMEKESLWMLLIVFVLSMWLCLRLEYIGHSRFPLFLERMVYIPLTVSALLLECRLCALLHSKVNAVLAFVGGVSLEIYLIHIQYVMKPLSALHLGYWGTAACTLAISIPAAWLLQKVLNTVVGKARQMITMKGKEK